MNAQTKNSANPQQLPQMKKTFDPRLPCSSSTTYGVMKAITKLSSQLVAVVIERALARTFSGKISPVTTQATGPPINKLATF